MPPDEVPAQSERDQTDESLRAERGKADATIEEQLTPIEEAADAVLSLARARADDLLAAARAKADEESIAPPGTRARRVIDRERAREDQALSDERAAADDTLRVERAEYADLLAAEREATDEDLVAERAQADDVVATRDEFLGIVSHDLRNMLNAVTGFAELIKHEAGDQNRAETVLRYVQRIERAGTRMDRLIGDLVDVVSIEAGTLGVTRQPGNPIDVVREAVETLQPPAAACEIAVVLEVEGGDPQIAFDPARLLQVLTNLLSNAIKFTPRHGRVVVRVEPDGDGVRITVSDTGPGIPADKLERVFERFLQLRPNDRRGVGLGLYISRSIVEAHGGRIQASSVAGRGTTISFTLPAAADRR